MTYAIPVSIEQGKINPRALYIKIKNGNIYRYHKDLPVVQADLLATKIRKANKVCLKYWKRCN